MDEDVKQSLKQWDAEIKAISARYRPLFLQTETITSHEEAMIKRYKRHIVTLRARADEACRAGDEIATGRLRRDINEYEQVIAIKRARWEKVMEEQDALEEMMKSEKEPLQSKIIGTQVRELQRAMTEGWQLFQDTTEAFAEAKRKIMQANADRLTRAELESWGFRFAPPSSESKKGGRPDGHETSWLLALRRLVRR